VSFVQEFSGEKIESTIFGSNSCSSLEGRGDHKYFLMAVVDGKNYFSFTLLLRHGGIRAQQRIFL